jgi:hypothetical protein
MKTKSTPNLPSSSRMKMPSGSGGSMKGSVKMGSKGTTSKVMSAAKGKTMSKKGY